jgi:hypothetical protein
MNLTTHGLPSRASNQSLLPHSPKRTRVRLRSLLKHAWLRQFYFGTHGRPLVQEYRLWLKRPTLCVPVNLNPRLRSALLPSTTSITQEIREGIAERALKADTIGGAHSSFLSFQKAPRRKISMKPDLTLLTGGFTGH